MKLLIMTPYYPPIHTAGSTRIFELTKYLSKKKVFENIDIVLWNPLLKFKKNEIPHLPNVNIKPIKFGRNFPEFLLRHQDPNPFYAFIWFLFTAYFTIKKKPDIMFFTSPPGVILCGSLWCKITGTKYVIDYRDDWIKVNKRIINNLSGFNKFIALYIHRLIELLAISGNVDATIITTVHPSIIDINNVNEEKIVELRNGINKVEVENVRNVFKSDDTLKKLKNLYGGYKFKNDKKIIAYVGHLLTPYYFPEVILPVLKIHSNYHLLILSTTISKRFNVAIEKQGVRGKVTITNYPHKEMLSILMACDIGFLSLQKNDPQRKFAIPTKFYDYISCGLPILVIADKDSYIFQFVEKYQNGIALSWEETKRIEESIDNLLTKREFKENAEKLLPTFIEMFDREKYFSKFENKLMKRL